MIADGQINRLNEPCAGFQVREITDEKAAAFGLKLKLKAGNSGRVKAERGAERAALPDVELIQTRSKMVWDRDDDPHAGNPSRNTSA